MKAIHMNGTKQAMPIIDEETREHLERASKMRFKQSLVQGFAGPTIFGLVGAGGAALMGMAATNPIAWVAIGLLACTAIGAMYVSSKLNAEVSRMDQDYQARQIAKGINGPVPTLEQKPTLFPSQSNAALVEQPLGNTPSLVVNHVTNLGRAAANEPARVHA